MKTAIVCFSLNGNCEYAAQSIAGLIPADVIRIEPVKKYPDKGFKKFLWGGKSAVMSETPRLEKYIFDAGDYDAVILGFPVWAGSIAPPMRTFALDNASELSKKRLFAFACQSGSGAEKAFVKLEACLGCHLAEKLVLIDPLTRPSAENDARIRTFAEAVIKNK